jgi:hypothetical protein
LLDIGSHIGYLQGLFYKYHESAKGQTTHNLYGGLPLWGDLIGYVVKPMRDLITDFDTSNILKGVLGPSWAIHTYSSEGGPFSATISCLCTLAFFLYFGVVSDY